VKQIVEAQSTFEVMRIAEGEEDDLADWSGPPSELEDDDNEQRDDKDGSGSARSEGNETLTCQSDLPDYR
jgi:hypothetical protein